MFREKLGDDPTDIDPDDTEDKDGLSALADAVLNTDLSGGLKIRGSLAANMGESELLELPLMRGYPSIWRNSRFKGFRARSARGYPPK